MSSHSIDLKLIHRALRHRNYRLYFYGQTISLIGTWAQRLAIGWLVYRLTGSAFVLGLVGFVGDLPAFLFAPLAGVLADRWPRHRLVVLLQALAMIQALVLAILVLTGAVTVWHVIVLSMFLGVLNAFDVPTRQSFLVELIERREDLGNAIALNSSMVNAARLLGPSLAGVLIATVGEGMCFLLNGISYVAVLASLLAMKIRPSEREAAGTRIFQELKQGFAYVAGFAPMRSILLLVALTSLMGVPYQVLMPVFAKDILHGGPYVLGFLMGCAGVGALAGAVYLAARKTVMGLESVITLAAGVFGIGLVAFSFSRILWLSLGLMVLTGFGMIVQLSSSNTVLQTIAEDDKRGRVMSFYTMAYRGMVPLGSLLAGILASTIGAPGTLLIGGVCCLAGSVLFARNLSTWRKAIRPLYSRLGFAPEAASGIPRSTDAGVPLGE